MACWIMVVLRKINAVIPRKTRMTSSSGVMVSFVNGLLLVLKAKQAKTLDVHACLEFVFFSIHAHQRWFLDLTGTIPFMKTRSQRDSFMKIDRCQRTGTHGVFQDIHQCRKRSVSVIPYIRGEHDQKFLNRYISTTIAQNNGVNSIRVTVSPRNRHASAGAAHE